MENLTLKKENSVAIISINRPPANALSSNLISEISSILDEIEHDQQIRSVIIRGEGRFFSAGADIKEFTQVKSGEEFSILAERGQQTFDKIEKFPKPIIAVVHGAALGGGLELAMACHLRLVSDTATLGLPELQLGIIPGFAGTQRLPRLVGPAKAAEMMLTSEPITGKEAVKWGLANKSFPEDELFEQGMVMAEKIAKKSPIVLRAVIEQLQYTKTNQFDKGVKREAERFGTLFNTEDRKEGIQAFLEKREPNFKGK
ncbi:enoyl-CoA hydratase [Lederbergia graminis]|uniref:Enoyl-CoA hydratase n=1 Tax=Lederbergia graminis TaxID=735518 RepID=A0ABW0LQC5_9BACI|nr:enoyl-CoA hydratase [Paenibacillus bovis]